MEFKVAIKIKEAVYAVVVNLQMYFKCIVEEYA